jgi:hypothetical protein
MRRRPIVKFRPDLERFEEKQLLSAGASAARAARPASGPVSPTLPANGSGDLGIPSGPNTPIPKAFMGYRITDPKKGLAVHITPPFGHVLVQTARPVPGDVYNVCYVIVKNGTHQTFTARNNFTVRVTNNQVPGASHPILTGNEQWRPNQWFIFYLLTKKYYPFSFVAGGFQLDLGGRATTFVPGPSGIFLRLKYNPSRINGQLDQIVQFGQGTQGGVGPSFGMPDTAINVIVAARTHRMDYGGHF